jgi:hypothetical protein
VPERVQLGAPPRGSWARGSGPILAGNLELPEPKRTSRVAELLNQEWRDEPVKQFEELILRRTRYLHNQHQEPGTRLAPDCT